MEGSARWKRTLESTEESRGVVEAHHDGHALEVGRRRMVTGARSEPCGGARCEDRIHEMYTVVTRRTDPGSNPWAVEHVGLTGCENEEKVA